MNFLPPGAYPRIADLDSLLPDPDNSIIREFLLLRNERNGWPGSETSTPFEDYSSCFSDSFSSSQVSDLSLRNKRPPPVDETPETDLLSGSHDQAPQNDGFTPILNTDSTESHSRAVPSNPALSPMRGSSVLNRYRRLLEDLEVSQGIRVSSFSGVDSESESDENSFTESMLAVDSQGPQDIVTWLSDQFKKSRKHRQASIDGLIMSHGVSRSFQNVSHKHRRSRWKPLKPSTIRPGSTRGNVFTRFMNHWRTARPPEPRPTFLVNRAPGDRYSSIF